ncbi:MAG: FHA domain-containing protein [Planctomycetes bacterium]|nr:FHA domain-containing protein [Planctomycetota bacterium]
MPKLQYAVQGQAFEVQIPAQGVRVGSAPDAGLQLMGPTMAPYHFTIFQHGGVFKIQDLGTPAGTFVNKQRLANHPVPLAVGASINAGGLTFLFVGDAPVAQAPPQVQAAPPQVQAPAAPQGRRQQSRPAPRPQTPQ